MIWNIPCIVQDLENHECALMGYLKIWFSSKYLTTEIVCFHKVQIDTFFIFQNASHDDESYTPLSKVNIVDLLSENKLATCILVTIITILINQTFRRNTYQAP